MTETIEQTEVKPRAKRRPKETRDRNWGEKLRMFRQAKSLTIKELAEKFDIAHLLLQRYETNVVDVPNNILLKYYNMGFNVDCLFKDNEPIERIEGTEKSSNLRDIKVLEFNQEILSKDYNNFRAIISHKQERTEKALILLCAKLGIDYHELIKNV